MVRLGFCHMGEECWAALGEERMSGFAMGHKGWHSCPKRDGNRERHGALQGRSQETLLQAGGLSLAPALCWYTMARAA